MNLIFMDINWGWVAAVLIAAGVPGVIAGLLVWHERREYPPMPKHHAPEVEADRRTTTIFNGDSSLTI